MILKTGDRIKYTEDTCSTFTKGEYYEVKGVNDNTVIITDDNGNNHLLLYSKLLRSFSLYNNKDTGDVCNDVVGNFIKIIKELHEVCVIKNYDYDNSFDKSLDRFGLIASVVRIGNKMNRIESLVLREAMVQDESIRGILLDMANYAIMTVMWMDNQHKSCEV